MAPTPRPVDPPSQELFGDLLARARRTWVRQMAQRLSVLGFEGYRRSDAAIMRLLHRRGMAIGELGSALGVTRQASRQAVAQLEARGLVTTVRDDQDSRRVTVTLSDAGRAYARAVIAVIRALNDDLSRRVDADRLEAARLVLREVIDLPSGV
jgi:DNA-binding MarR family transcriptional regulator